MPLDWKCGALAAGLACYGKTEFFEAHEHWESAWLQLQEPEKSFLQALIQITAAFHHLQTGNKVGTVSLLRRALRQLETRSACFGDVEVKPLSDEVREWVRALESGSSSPAMAFPRICPIEEPDQSESQD